MAESIRQLRIYTNARELEDRVYELTKQLPTEDDYPTGNDLRRASAAVCYHLTEAHNCFSYGLRIENLTLARDAATSTQQLLTKLVDETAQSLSKDYTAVIKQAWGFINYLKSKQREKQERSAIRAKDELVAARA